jgi:hypothetical protein|tara:strand:+ start:44050 stop:44646 length:597 start_codon:yes stop_codon:yes gene_type:complete
MAVKGTSNETWLLGGAVIVTVAFLVVALFNPGAFDPEPDWEVSDGCLGGLQRNDEGELVHAESKIAKHYHPSLRIIMNGQNFPIDANTGVDQPGCREGMRWIHVHSAAEGTGFTTLHIETPSAMNVPLGSFFEVWGMEGGPTLDGDRNFDINRNGVSDWEEYNISMTVDGEPNEKFESFIMGYPDQDGAKIELIFTSK